jgi:hypothetical protein
MAVPVTVNTGDRVPCQSIDTHNDPKSPQGHLSPQANLSGNSLAKALNHTQDSSLRFEPTRSSVATRISDFLSLSHQPILQQQRAGTYRATIRCRLHQCHELANCTPRSS